MQNFMRYVYSTVIPLLLQVLVVYIIIAMNTGNGSFLGLAAFLFAIPVIPITAIVNAVRTSQKKEMETFKLFLQSLMFSIAIPTAIIGAFIVMIVIEGLLR